MLKFIKESRAQDLTAQDHTSVCQLSVEDPQETNFTLKCSIPTREALYKHHQNKTYTKCVPVSFLLNTLFNTATPKRSSSDSLKFEQHPRKVLLPLLPFFPATCGLTRVMTWSLVPRALNDIEEKTKTKKTKKTRKEEPLVKRLRKTSKKINTKSKLLQNIR